MPVENLRVGHGLAASVVVPRSVFSMRACLPSQGPGQRLASEQTRGQSCGLSGFSSGVRMTIVEGLASCALRDFHADLIIRNPVGDSCRPKNATHAHFCGMFFFYACVAGGLGKGTWFSAPSAARTVLLATSLALCMPHFFLHTPVHATGLTR